MKKLIYIFCILLISCNVSKNVTTGIYQKRGKDFKTTLELNSANNTFVLTESFWDGKCSCSGIWKQEGDTIFLNCYEETDIALMLQSGYMTQREFIVEVQNSNKLKLGNIILKRNN